MGEPDDRDALEAEILAGMAAEIDEGDEVVTDDDLADDDEPASSIDDLGLPMPVLPAGRALELLTRGELSLVGRLWASTNNAMLCLATLPGAGDGGADLEAACIYKPVMGERPLGDFPDLTLGRREVASFAVSRASGWDIVPPTVLRDGPFGEGMVQLWIRPDPDADPVRMVVDEDPCLRPIAVFDAAVNNTDRKAGHLIPVPGRARVRGGPRRHVLAGAQAADGPVGLARPAVLRGRGGGAHGAPHGARRAPRRGAARAPGSRSRWRRRAGASTGCWRPGCSRSRTRAGRRCPGRPSEVSPARGGRGRRRRPAGA